MSFSKTLGAGLAAGALLILTAGDIKAGDNIFKWIGVGRICYDYDPYDRYHEFGKYYPYSGKYCRRRIKRHAIVIAKHEGREERRRCTRSKAAKIKKACHG